MTSGWWRSCRGTGDRTGAAALKSSPPAPRSRRKPALRPFPCCGPRARAAQAGRHRKPFPCSAPEPSSSPALARGRRLGESLVVVAMADAHSWDLPAVQVLLDLEQRRIRWRVLLVPRPGSTPWCCSRSEAGRAVAAPQAGPLEPVAWHRVHPSPRSGGRWPPPPLPGGAERGPAAGCAPAAAAGVGAGAWAPSAEVLMGPGGQGPP